MKISLTQFALSAFVGLFLTFNQISNAQNAAPPTLSGDAAIEQLKQNGEYESLLKAVENARDKNGRREESPGEQNAVGQTARLNAGDGAAGDQFGTSVAVSGNTAVIGAYLDDVNGNTDQGSAYVFTKTGTAMWTEQAQLSAMDGAADDLFGTSVAISGETVVVGANRDVNGTISGQGSAYIFTRSGTVWTQQQKITADDGAEFDLFGVSVGISGETLVVGAYFDNVGNNSDQGSAYIFTRSGATWTQRQKLTANGGAANDFFGYSVAINDDTIVIGAYGDDVGTVANQGSAYVFTKAGDVWTQQAQLVAMDGANGDLFGIGVAISGNTIVVGAYADNVVVNGTSNGDQGSAYVFVRNGTTWMQQTQLVAADGAAGDLFGLSVGISGDTVIVGSYQDDVSSQNQGSAYLYMRSGTTWTQQAQLTAADGAEGDAFGLSVAAGGENLLVGSVLHAVGANDNQGSVYSYRVLTANYTLETRTTSNDGAFDDHFGISVAVSGDTAVVGAYLDDVGASGDQQGSAYIFIRVGTRWRLQTQLLAMDGAAFDRFGVSVSIDGETVIVGAYQPSVGTVSGRGAAYIFTGTGTNWTQQAKLTATDGTVGDQFGYSAAISGETVVVGANADDVGANTDQGSAYIFTRSGTTWTQRTQLAAMTDNINDSAAGDQFGNSVAIDGNTVVVGAVFDDLLLNVQQGSAYVFVGSGATWTQQAKLQSPLDPTGGSANDRFGFSVAVSRDTAVVGAIFDNVGSNNNQGSAYVFIRSGTTWTQQAQLLAADGAADDRFGSSAAISGDIVVVGAFSDDVGDNFDQGSAYVFERTGTTWAQKTRLIDTIGMGNDQFGSSVAISGDKIAVGAPNSDNTTFDGFSRDAENRFNAPEALDQGSVLFYVNAPLAPTAAMVTVSGRAMSSAGRGIRNVVIRMTDVSGNVRTATTTAFGYYRFAAVEAGETYIITATGKRSTFSQPSHVLNIYEDTDGINFISNPIKPVSDERKQSVGSKP